MAAIAMVPSITSSALMTHRYGVPKQALKRCTSLTVHVSSAAAAMVEFVLFMVAFILVAFDVLMVVVGQGSEHLAHPRLQHVGEADRQRQPPWPACVWVSDARL